MLTIWRAKQPRRKLTLPVLLLDEEECNTCIKLVTDPFVSGVESGSIELLAWNGHIWDSVKQWHN